MTRLTWDRQGGSPAVFTVFTDDRILMVSEEEDEDFPPWHASVAMYPSLEPDPSLEGEGWGYFPTQEAAMAWAEGMLDLESE